MRRSADEAALAVASEVDSPLGAGSVHPALADGAGLVWAEVVSAADSAVVVDSEAVLPPLDSVAGAATAVQVVQVDMVDRVGETSQTTCMPITTVPRAEWLLMAPMVPARQWQRLESQVSRSSSRT